MLLKVLEFEQISADDDANATWIIPSSSYPTSSKLEEALQQLTQHETSLVELPDGRSAEDFIQVKRKATTSRARRAEFDDDDDDDDDDDTPAINTENENGEPLFPAGGPTSRPSDPLDKDINKRNRRRHRLAKLGVLDDADAEAARAQRAHARQRAEASKRHKIKSDLFVHESDDEDDAERDDAFFTMEESRRRGFDRQVDAVLGKRGSPLEDNDEYGVQLGQTVEIHGDIDADVDLEVPWKRSRRKGAFRSKNDDLADPSDDDMNGITSTVEEQNDVMMLSDTSTTSSQRSCSRSNRRRMNRKRNQIRKLNSYGAIDDTGPPTISHSGISSNVIESSNENKNDDCSHNNNYNSDTNTNTNSNLEDTTPLSSQNAEESGQKQYSPEEHTKNATPIGIEDERDNHNISLIPRKEDSIRTRNVRAGFVIDSDSE